MDGYLGVWMGKWMGGWMDGVMDECLDGWTGWFWTKELTGPAQDHWYLILLT